MRNHESYNARFSISVVKIWLNTLKSKTEVTVLDKWLDIFG